MAMIEINWRPSQKDLRNFGWISLAMLTVVALLLHWWKDLGAFWSLCICAVGLLVYVLSRISTILVRPIYVALTVATWPIGWALSHLAMAILYYLVLTPIGLLFRVVGRDSLDRRFDRSAETYWKPPQPPDNIERYFKQF